MEFTTSPVTTYTMTCACGYGSTGHPSQIIALRAGVDHRAAMHNDDGDTIHRGTE